MSGDYFVHVAESVEAYIRAIDALPAQRRQQVLDWCLDDLGREADHFLRRYPLEHESYSFEYQYAFIEGGLIYSFRFIADGSQMVVGVVQVIYVDYETMAVDGSVLPPPPRR
jgi:hypothetical protein